MSHSKIAKIYKIYVTNYGSRLSLSDFWYSNAYKFQLKPILTVPNQAI